MDFMSFLLGGMLVADIMEEYYRDCIEDEIYEDYIYEIEQHKEQLQNYYALKHGDEELY